ncbi:hypothetical protein AVEN_170530-1, partial [Araneus ventricosus]
MDDESTDLFANYNRRTFDPTDLRLVIHESSTPFIFDHSTQKPIVNVKNRLELEW